MLLCPLTPTQAAVETTSHVFYCTRAIKDSIHMFSAFELTVTPLNAAIDLKPAANLPEVIFAGHLDRKYKPRDNQGWIRYEGFENLLREYDATLIVSPEVQTGHPGKVTLEGRGEVYTAEDYMCE